jgi:hypothetical protein
MQNYIYIFTILSGVMISNQNKIVFSEKNKIYNKKYKKLFLNINRQAKIISKNDIINEELLLKKNFFFSFFFIFILVIKLIFSYFTFLKNEKKKFFFIEEKFKNYEKNYKQSYKKSSGFLKELQNLKEEINYPDVQRKFEENNSIENLHEQSCDIAIKKYFFIKKIEKEQIQNYSLDSLIEIIKELNEICKFERKYQTQLIKPEEKFSEKTVLDWNKDNMSRQVLISKFIAQIYTETHHQFFKDALNDINHDFINIYKKLKVKCKYKDGKDYNNKDKYSITESEDFLSIVLLEDIVLMKLITILVKLIKHGEIILFNNVENFMKEKKFFFESELETFLSRDEDQKITRIKKKEYESAESLGFFYVCNFPSLMIIREFFLVISYQKYQETIEKDALKAQKNLNEPEV